MALDTAKRANGIGGSEACACMGMSPYMTPLDVWMVKTGREKGFEGNAATLRGQRLEPVVAQYLQDELDEIGATVLTADEFRALSLELPSGAKMEDSDTLVHPLHSFMVGSPDRYILLQNRKLMGAELKSTELHIKSSEDVFNKAMSWVLQSQYYMMLTGLRSWQIAWIHTPSWGFYYIEIQYDEKLAQLIQEEISHFWKYNVLADIAPEPQTAEDVVKLYQRPEGIIEATDMLASEIIHYAGLKRAEKALKERIEESKEKIALAVLGFKSIQYRGKIIATFKRQETTRINTKALKKEAPKIFEEFSETSSTRVLRLKKNKE